ncbi:hypothetical protein [Collimonas sp. OK242]|uniref:hypothetical protein n=1 Tax=Collimonas sp. OK242 TaxID=1798195 RepID=UPI000B879882|nr:hypothetical protein [Collimonas sp. OK242]
MFVVINVVVKKQNSKDPMRKFTGSCLAAGAYATSAGLLRQTAVNGIFPRPRRRWSWMGRSSAVSAALAQRLREQIGGDHIAKSGARSARDQRKHRPAAMQSAGKTGMERNVCLVLASIHSIAAECDPQHIRYRV